MVWTEKLPQSSGNPANFPRKLNWTGKILGIAFTDYEIQGNALANCKSPLRIPWFDLSAAQPAGKLNNCIHEVQDSLDNSYERCWNACGMSNRQPPPRIILGLTDLAEKIFSGIYLVTCSQHNRLHIFGICKARVLHVKVGATFLSRSSICDSKLENRPVRYQLLPMFSHQPICNTPEVTY